jgi:outer membrane protein assembly factor BamB
VDLATTKNVLWVARMGSQTYGNPTVSNGRLFVGTNNEGRGDPRFKGDHSVVKCLDAATGKEIWTLTVPKLGGGKVNDWEYLGICSSPTVVDDRVYLVTNRCEVVCLDVNGMADGNQGLQDEGQAMSLLGTTPQPPVEVKATDADILWRYDMLTELGIFPHNITSSSILVVGDILYCSTSNGVTYDHTDIPSPKAPTLVALNRKIAERPGARPAEILVGEEGSGLSKRIFHGVWTSPCWGEIDGKGVILFGGPDGFCYAFDPDPVKDADGFGVFPEKWRFDCNPPNYRYRDGDKSKPIRYASLGEGPSEILATPVFYKGRVYAPIGQDPEHRGGPGNLTCLDAATGRKVWDLRINRSMSTCSIVNDLLYLVDFNGWLYCIDANDGKLYWNYDSLSEVWCSTLVADGKVYLGGMDKRMTVFSTDRMKKLADEFGGGIEVEVVRKKLILKKEEKTVREISGDEVEAIFHEATFPAEIHCTPIVAQGALYVATFRYLYAIKATGK